MSVDLIEFNVISMKNGDVLGTFKGNLEYYESFKVMKGTFYGFHGKNWNLVAFGRDPSKIMETFPGPQLTEEVIVIDYGAKTQAILIAKAYN